MAHAVFVTYACRCDAFSCNTTMAKCEAVTGYGPLWKELGQAMQAEANRALCGLGVRYAIDALTFPRSEDDCRIAY